MRSSSFTSRFKALQPEKKILIVTSAVAAIACFLPWYGINSRVINEWWNAFGSIGSVAGYIVFAFSVCSLIGLVTPLIRSELDIFKKLPISDTSAYMFLNGQSFFVSLLFIPVYSQYSLINATNSGTRFGLYVALVSTLIGTIVATAYHKRKERLDIRTQEFASVPRAQKSLNEWSNEEVEPAMMSDEFEQEEMFETAEQEPVQATYSQYNQQDIIEDNSTYPSDASDRRYS